MAKYITLERADSHLGAMVASSLSHGLAGRLGLPSPSEAFPGVISANAHRIYGCVMIAWILGTAGSGRNRPQLEAEFRALEGDIASADPEVAAKAVVAREMLVLDLLDYAGRPRLQESRTIRARDRLIQELTGQAAPRESNVVVKKELSLRWDGRHHLGGEKIPHSQIDHESLRYLADQAALTAVGRQYASRIIDLCLYEIRQRTRARRPAPLVVVVQKSAIPAKRGQRIRINWPGNSPQVSPADGLTILVTDRDHDAIADFILGKLWADPLFEKSVLDAGLLFF